jgi:hypothetical protein
MKEWLRESRDEGSSADLDAYQRRCVGDWQFRQFPLQIMFAELWADFVIEVGAIPFNGC